MSFVCIIIDAKMILYKQLPEINGYKCGDILKRMNYTQNFDLYYSSPIYAEKIPETDYPIELFPELVINNNVSKHLHPMHYLMILPKRTGKIFYLSIKINVTNSCEIPPIRLEFDKDLFKTGDDILNHINNNFDLENFDGETNSFLKDDNAGMIFENAKKNMIEFNCKLTQKAMNCVKSREDLLCDILRTKSSYVSICLK